MKDEGNGHLEAVGSREKFYVVTAVCVIIRAGCVIIRAGGETRCGLDGRVRKKTIFLHLQATALITCKKGDVGFSGNGGSCLLGYIFVYQINNNNKNKYVITTIYY